MFSDPVKKLKTETIDGRKVDIYINGNGSFFVNVDGDVTSDKTLEGLLAKLRRLFRQERVRLSIPCTMIGIKSARHLRDDGFDEEGQNWRDFTITGKHARSGNILIKWSDGTTDQIRSYGSGTVCRRLSDAEKKQYTELARAKAKATADYAEFAQAHELAGRSDIDNYIKEQIESAIDEPREPAEVITGDPRLDAKLSRATKGKRR